MGYELLVWGTFPDKEALKTYHDQVFASFLAIRLLSLVVKIHTSVLFLYWYVKLKKIV